jgi:hypothetical protein
LKLISGEEITVKEIDKNFQVILKKPPKRKFYDLEQLRIQEIQAFSTYLGVNLQKEPNYVFMIKNRLKSPLIGWDIHYTNKGDRYYRNS